MSRETDARKLVRNLPDFELFLPKVGSALVHMPFVDIVAGVCVDRISSGTRRRLLLFSQPFCFGAEHFLLSGDEIDSRTLFDLSQPSEQARALQAIRELALPWILRRKTLTGLLECTPEPDLTRIVPRVEKAPRFAFLRSDVRLLLKRVHLLAALSRSEEAIETIHKIVQQYEYEKIIATPEPHVSEQDFSQAMKIRCVLLAGPEAVRQWLADNSQRTRRGLGFI